MKTAGLIGFAFAASILIGCAQTIEILRPPKFTAQGQTWIDALEADAKGDVASSVAKFRALANANDPYAAWVLGSFYQGGERVGRDLAQSERWYREAAARGYVQGKYQLSLIEKRGWPESHLQQYQWLKEDADSGIVEAQHALGTYHKFGQVVPRSPAEAAKWWTLSAGHGYATSQARLALLYSKGDGVPRDEARAYAWMTLATANLLPSAVKDIAVGLRNNWQMKLSSEQLSRAEKLIMAFVKTTEEAPKLDLARETQVTADQAPEPAKETVAEVITGEAANSPTATESTTDDPSSHAEDKTAGEDVVSSIPPPQNQFLLHLASHRTEAKALLEWELLMQKFTTELGGLQPIIQSVNLKDRGVFYRVQAGPVESRTSALDLCLQFKARKQYCRVFRYR